MGVLVCIILILLTCLTTNANAISVVNGTNAIPLHIGGFLQDSHYSLLATEICVKHANDVDGILDGYELYLRWIETPRETPGAMLQYLFDFVYKPPFVLGIIGPMYSSLCVEMCEVASSYGINQITIGVSTSLKDRDKYPLTVQSYYEKSITTPAWVAFIKLMGWNRVAMVIERVESIETYKDISLLLIEEGISVIAYEIVTDSDDASEQIKSLLRRDARIIFTEFYGRGRAKFICQAYKLGMWGSKYVWVMAPYVPPDWWIWYLDELPCSVDEMYQITHSTHFFGALPAVYPNPDISTMSFNGVKLTDQQVKEIPHDIATEYLYGLYYDSCMSLVLALNRSVEHLAALNKSLETFEYSDLQTANIINDNLLKVDFIGLTGSMSFISDGTRSNDVAITEVLEINGTWDWHDVLKYSVATNKLRKVENQPFFWQNGFRPVDGKTEILRVVRIKQLYRISMYSLTSLGLCVSSVFAVINVIYRHKRAIKLSSPKLNNLILCGSFLLYASVFLFGQDTSNLTERYIIILCKVRLAFICIGFSLSFGTLFMKTYRIKAIFLKAVKHFQRVNVSDSKLMVGVLIPVMIDILILVVLIFATEPVISTHRFEPELDTSNPNAEIYIVPVVEYCTSSYEFYFTVIIYGVKAVLLTFGVFLAWEIRNVKISALNDSKYIAMSVYTVAVILAILIPSLNLTFYDVDLYFIVMATAIVFINTTVLCLIFLPKALLLLKSRGQDIRITMMTDHSSNLTYETTTGVTVNKILKNKEESLQAILNEKKQRLDNLKRQYARSLKEFGM